MLFPVSDIGAVVETKHLPRCIESRCLGWTCSNTPKEAKLHEGSASSVRCYELQVSEAFTLNATQTRQLRSRGTRDPTAARVICLVPLPCGIGTPLFYPIPCPKTSRKSKFAEWRNIGRSNSQSCAAKMAAFPVSGGIAARGALFLNGGTLEIASVSAEVNSIVPYLCAVYSRVNVPRKIPVLVHKYAIEIFRGRHFLED